MQYERNHRWSAEYGGNGTQVYPVVHGSLKPERRDGRRGSLSPSMKDAFGNGHGKYESGPGKKFCLANRSRYIGLYVRGG